MKITLCGSISFAKGIIELRNKLVDLGHEVFIPASIEDFSIKDFGDAERLKSNEKYISNIKPYYTKYHFDLIKENDAILVVNFDKNDIKNYIGGATFAEIMLALYLGKKIFLLNPIPKDKRLSFIKDELEAAKPVILNGNLEIIR